MSAHCDVAIIGGGPVGAALALALRDSGLRVIVLEARMAEDASADPRALALSYGSRLLLERLGVWNKIALVSAINIIHISQKNSCGRAVLRAAELHVPDLGYVLPYPALQAALQGALQASAITYLTGAAVTQLQTDSNSISKVKQGGDERTTKTVHSVRQGVSEEANAVSPMKLNWNEVDGARITYQHEGSEHALNARLAVVADGGKLLETTHPPTLHDYGQSAIITHVTCEYPQPDTAFERFTAHGPVALLPYKGGYELVWTVAHDAAQEMLQWNDAVFLAQLHQHFGDRVGEFLTVGKRVCFPLRLKRAPNITLPHTVLLGNAAQTLHPVAGQGFNMGLRDAWELAQIILHSSSEALGATAMLESYTKSRRLDRNAGIHFTDSLVRTFSNDLPLLSGGRGLALSVLDCLPGAKKFVTKRMMFGANG